jgi:hypothetical protein
VAWDRGVALPELVPYSEAKIREGDGIFCIAGVGLAGIEDDDVEITIQK